MLAVVAAVVFAIAFLINATGTATDAVFSPFSLELVGLALLALHIGDAYSRSATWRRRSRR